MSVYFCVILNHCLWYRQSSVDSFSEIVLGLSFHNYSYCYCYYYCYSYLYLNLLFTNAVKTANELHSFQTVQILTDKDRDRDRQGAKERERETITTVIAFNFKFILSATQRCQC